MLERDAGHQQAQLVRLGILADVAHAGPEFVHRDIEVVDGHHEIV